MSFLEIVAEEYNLLRDFSGDSWRDARERLMMDEEYSFLVPALQSVLKPFGRGGSVGLLVSGALASFPDVSLYDALEGVGKYCIVFDIMQYEMRFLLHLSER